MLWGFFCSLWNTVRADATQRTHTGTIIHEYSPVWKKTTIIFTKKPTKSICINCFTIKSTYLETLLYTELFMYHYIVHIDLEGEKNRLSPSGFTCIFRYDVMIDIVCYFFCRTLIQAWHFILSLNIIFFDKFVTILSYENETFEKKITIHSGILLLTVVYLWEIFPLFVALYKHLGHFYQNIG